MAGSGSQSKDQNSDRLKQLALPNCHLVEAVLKEHYHVFDDNCRDRLKKLLELILTVNTTGRSRYDQLNDSLKQRCISNLRKRLQSLESTDEQKEKQKKEKDWFFYRKSRSLDDRNSFGDHVILDESSKDDMEILFKAEDQKEEFGDCQSDYKLLDNKQSNFKKSSFCKVKSQVDSSMVLRSPRKSQLMKRRKPELKYAESFNNRKRYEEERRRRSSAAEKKRRKLDAGDSVEARGTFINEVASKLDKVTGQKLLQEATDSNTSACLAKYVKAKEDEKKAKLEKNAELAKTMQEETRKLVENDKRSNQFLGVGKRSLSEEKRRFNEEKRSVGEVKRSLAERKRCLSAEIKQRNFVEQNKRLSEQKRSSSFNGEKRKFSNIGQKRCFASCNDQKRPTSMSNEEQHRILIEDIERSLGNNEDISARRMKEQRLIEDLERSLVNVDERHFLQEKETLKLLESCLLDKESNKKEIESETTNEEKSENNIERSENSAQNEITIERSENSAENETGVENSTEKGENSTERRENSIERSDNTTPERSDVLGELSENSSKENSTERRENLHFERSPKGNYTEGRKKLTEKRNQTVVQCQKEGISENCNKERIPEEKYTNGKERSNSCKCESEECKCSSIDRKQIAKEWRLNVRECNLHEKVRAPETTPKSEERSLLEKWLKNKSKTTEVAKTLHDEARKISKFLDSYKMRSSSEEVPRRLEGGGTGEGAKMRGELLERRRGESEKRRGEFAKRRGECERRRGECEKRRGECEKRRGECEKRRGDFEKRRGDGESGRGVDGRERGVVYESGRGVDESGRGVDERGRGADERGRSPGRRRRSPVGRGKSYDDSQRQKYSPEEIRRLLSEEIKRRADAKKEDDKLLPEEPHQHHNNYKRSPITVERTPRNLSNQCGDTDEKISLSFKCLEEKTQRLSHFLDAYKDKENVKSMSVKEDIDKVRRFLKLYNGNSLEAEQKRIGLLLKKLEEQDRGCKKEKKRRKRSRGNSPVQASGVREVLMIGDGDLGRRDDGSEEEQKNKALKHFDITKLVVKFYLALMADMQKNYRLYDSFTKALIQPTESYKQPYLQAAYQCWMEYTSYVSSTLDYLQPYVVSLVKVYNKYESGHAKLQDFETKIPKVLINSIKNMKPWRRALSETVQCCRDLVGDDGRKENLAYNVHKMYLRYHKKVRCV